MDIDFHDPSVIDEFRNRNKSINSTLLKIDLIKWDRRTCTIDSGPTDAYGDIKFLGSNQILSKVLILYF